MPGGGGPGETAQTQIRHGNTDPFTDPSITSHCSSRSPKYQHDTQLHFSCLIFPGSTGAVMKRTTSHWSL